MLMKYIAMYVFYQISNNCIRQFVFIAQLDRRARLTQIYRYNLQKFKINLTEASSCPICLMEIAESGIKLHCSHLYHENCILDWINYKSNCPVCREFILT